MQGTTTLSSSVLSPRTDRKWQPTVFGQTNDPIPEHTEYR